MKTKLPLLIVLLLIKLSINAQISTNSIPYIETTAKIDTLIVPDRIYLNITINEADSRGKISIEKHEYQMKNVLTGLGIDIKKQFSLFHIKSNFRQYFLRKKDVLKTKSFSLLLYDSETAGNVLTSLEQKGISNVFLYKTDYSKLDELKTNMRAKVIKKAKQQAMLSAQSIDQSIGKAIYISDFDPNTNQAFSGHTSGIKLRGYSGEYINTALGINRASDIKLDFDKIQIESAITAKFELL